MNFLQSRFNSQGQLMNAAYPTTLELVNSYITALELLEPILSLPAPAHVTADPKNDIDQVFKYLTPPFDWNQSLRGGLNTNPRSLSVIAGKDLVQVKTSLVEMVFAHPSYWTQYTVKFYQTLKESSVNALTFAQSGKETSFVSRASKSFSTVLQETGKADAAQNLVTRERLSEDEKRSLFYDVILPASELGTPRWSVALNRLETSIKRWFGIEEKVPQNMKEIELYLQDKRGKDPLLRKVQEMGQLVRSVSIIANPLLNVPIFVAEQLLVKIQQSIFNESL